MKKSLLEKIKWNKKQKGQSLVEFALTLTLLLTLLAGVVDLGSAFFDWIALRDAAQEGALYGSIAPEDITGIVNRVRQSSTMPLDLSDPAVTVGVGISGGACRGGRVTVTVGFGYTLSMPFIGAILGTNVIPLSASVTDTILMPPCTP